MRRKLIVVALLLCPAVAWAVAKVNRRGTGGIEYDAPRTQFSLCALAFTAATTEAMITLTPVRDGVASSTGTTFPVTGGKRLRLISWCVATRNAGAAVQGLSVRLRIDPASTVTTADPAVAILAAGTASATANVANATCQQLDVDNGLEISGSAQVGISQIGTATAGNDVCLNGYEY